MTGARRGYCRRLGEPASAPAPEPSDLVLQLIDLQRKVAEAVSNTAKAVEKGRKRRAARLALEAESGHLAVRRLVN